MGQQLNNLSIEEDRVLFEKLCDLVQHNDTQLYLVNKNHLTILGSLVAVVGLLTRTNMHWLGYFAVCLLALAFVLHWLILNTKLSLEKLCWTRYARDVEKRMFGKEDGPYQKQRHFFDHLDNPQLSVYVTRTDRWLVRFPMKRLKHAPFILLTLAIAVVAGLTLVRKSGMLSWDFLQGQSPVPQVELSEPLHPRPSSAAPPIAPPAAAPTATDRQP